MYNVHGSCPSVGLVGLVWNFGLSLVAKFQNMFVPSPADRDAVAVLGKIFGAWPLIIWEATTAKRNYYSTRKPS